MFKKKYLSVGTKVLYRYVDGGEYSKTRKDSYGAPLFEYKVNEHRVGLIQSVARIMNTYANSYSYRYLIDGKWYEEGTIGEVIE